MDYPYGVWNPFYGPPQNSVKIISKDSTSGLACRTGAIFFAYFRWTEANARRARNASRARGEEHKKILLFRRLLMGCLIDYLCHSCWWNFKCYTMQMQQTWVSNPSLPPYSPPPLAKICLKAVRCRWHKKGKFCLPFMAQSGYARCVFRSFRLACIFNSAEQIVKPGTSSWTHGRMGWTKSGGEFRGFSEGSQRLPGGSLRASRSFIHCIATTKEMQYVII